MTTNDDFAAANEILAETFGVTAITYTPSQGIGVAIQGDVGEDQEEVVTSGSDRTGSDRTIKRRRRDVVISTDPASTYGGIADPQTKATVTIGGIDYSVADVFDMPGGYVHLVCVRPERMERRHDYRGMQ